MYFFRNKLPKFSKEKIAVPLNFYNNRPMIENELLFILEVRIPEQTPIEYEIGEQFLAGLDPRNDLILVDPKVKTKHFIFRNGKSILTVHYTGADGDSLLNGIPLEKDKTYILEKGDILKVGRIDIIIHHKIGIRKIAKPLPTLQPEKEVMKTIMKPKLSLPEINQIPEPIKKNKSPIIDFRTTALIPYKFYGFLIDISLTYLMLSFVFPKLEILAQVQDFSYPISEFMTQYLMNNYPKYLNTISLSLLDFFIYFHCLMIPSSLVLGTTPGAFLVGLHQKRKNNFIVIRFKAYIYALINIAALPLIIFDIPIYKGRNAKEILTISERELSDTPVFNFSRKAIAPLLIMANFFSPFFLPLPYNANIAIESLQTPKYIDTHTFQISSYSRELGVSLKTELNQKFRILPYLENKKLGLMLYDFKTKKSLILKEQRRIKNEVALYKLRYSNPLTSLTVADNAIVNEVLKNKTAQSLNLSLTKLAKGFQNFGPFLGNGFLFKLEFLKNFSENDNFICNSFGPKIPVIKISISNREEKIFLFSRKEIIEFTISDPEQSQLIDVFMTSILGNLKFDQSSDYPLSTGIKEPQVLEVLDAFERSYYQTILTYYIKEANRSKETNDPEWQVLLKTNLEQTKKALFEDTTRVGLTKNIEKSFDEIISTL